MPVKRLTTDAGAAIAGADLVILMGPTHAHADMVNVVVPHLAPGQILLAAPGHTVLLIPNLLRKHGRGDIAFCDTATLPYIVRKSGPRL